MTQLLYQHGKFTSLDSQATADALYCYSFSLIAYGLLKVLSSYYYAVERTNYAMKVSLFSILVNFAANMFFVSSFGHKGLALSTLTLNALFLVWGLRQDRLLWQKRKLAISISMMSLAFALAFGLQYGIQPFLAEFSFLSGLALKWRASLVILINGSMVVTTFAAFWWILARKLKTGQAS